jgi:TIR domain
MKPAERIPLLKKLATALSDDDEPWKETALVLRQFGFRSHDNRDYDDYGNSLGPPLYEMVLDHLENSGDDEKLLELERYIDPADGNEITVPASVGPGPWKDENAFRLFISHTHPNAPFAAEMKKYLSKFLIESFVAHNDIEPSEKWMRVIESSLLTCHAVVALVTPDFRQSQWCDQEVGFALARSMLVVPLMREVDPHGFLSEFQGVKLNEHTHPQTAAASIFRILATRPETSARMVPSIVRRYSASPSFENTREAFTLLGRIPKDAWTPDLVFEANLGAIENSQIKKANLKNGTPVREAAAKLLLPIEKRLGIETDIPF